MKNFRKLLSIGLVALALFVTISKTQIITAGVGDEKDPPLSPVITASGGDEKDPPLRIVALDIVPCGGGDEKDPPL